MMHSQNRSKGFSPNARAREVQEEKEKKLKEAPWRSHSIWQHVSQQRETNLQIMIMQHAACIRLFFMFADTTQPFLHLPHDALDLQSQPQIHQASTMFRQSRSSSKQSLPLVVPSASSASDSTAQTISALCPSSVTISAADAV